MSKQNGCDEIIVELRKKCYECDYDKGMTFSIDVSQKHFVTTDMIQNAIRRAGDGFSSHTHQTQLSEKIYLRGKDV